jgi:hypothetical protein
MVVELVRAAGQLGGNAEVSRRASFAAASGDSHNCSHVGADHHGVADDRER